ncbi:MAG TPA: ATP-binding cassette domain-containing protein [Acidobacteriota bacterium]|jgi:ABC-2 type transport system ATP-binding protein|nr:ATP-binding cassette domain-containing protein [Acidobacteriota bacterium]
MPSIIKIKNLTKRFGSFIAVDHLDLEIREGEILGLLGPNGAGKTTTLLMLTTVIRPTEGTAYIGPYDVTREPDKARTLVGMAFQEPKLLWVDAPWDILNWHAKVCGLSPEERKKRVRWALEELELWNDRLKSVHTFSGGMRKRVEIAKILIQRPKIAIVDEPTAQIDIVGKHRVWNMLCDLRNEGSTILLATNELYEADVLSNRVAIMHKGKLLICDEPQKLKDSIPGGDVIEITLEKDVPNETFEKLKKIQRVVNALATKQNQLKIYLNQAEEVLPKITEFFMKEQLPVRSIRMREPSLDDVFAHYTGLTIEEAQRQ